MERTLIGPSASHFINALSAAGMGGQKIKRLPGSPPARHSATDTKHEHWRI
jgi:hypothetical protein